MKVEQGSRTLGAVSMQRTHALSLAALLLLGVGVLLWWRSEPVQPEQPSPPPPKRGPEAAPPLQAPAPEPTLQPPPVEDKTGWITYPDGSRYPPLNGVKVAPAVSFHPRLLPFTRVLRVERDASGRDWYVHEDGARSTTYLDASGKAFADVSKAAAAQPSADPPQGGK